MTSRICNLYQEIIAVVEVEEGKADSRFQHWIKRVNSVDQTRANGYCFNGEFVNDGTVEAEVKPTVYLTKTVRGSRKYQTATYNVVVMDTGGALSITDITTDDSSRGWALRIRDQVGDLVESLAEIKPTANEKFLTVLHERFPTLTEAKIITAALNVYEMHTRPA